MGRILQTGFPYELDERLLSEHILCIGRAGGGKTTAIKALILAVKRAAPHINVVIIERKREFTDLARELGMPVITTATLRINPLVPPAGVSSQIWKSTFAQGMVDDHEILLPTSNLIMEAYDDVLRIHGNVGSSSRRMPTLRDLYNQIASKKYPPGSRMAGYQAAAINRLGGLLNALPHVFDTVRGYDVSRMIQMDHLILLHDIPHLVHQNYIIKTVLDWMFVYRMIVQGISPGVTTIVVLDEAMSLFRRTDEIQRIPAYTSYVISQARAYGISIVATSQYAGDLSQALRANTTTKILVGGMEENFDRRAFLDLRPHTAEQAEVVKSFREPGHAFISDCRHSHFIECMIIRPDLPPPMSDEEIAMRAEETAAAMGWKLPEDDHAPTPRDEGSPTVRAATASERSSTESHLSEDDSDRFLLRDVEETPYQTMEVRGERLGVPKNIIRAQIERLSAKHWIVVYKVHNRAGSPRDLYETTSEGYRILGKEKPKARGHGSYLHQFYQRAIAAHWRAHGYDVQIEGRADEKAVDILAVQRPEGETVAIELELSVRTSKHFLHNMRADLQSPRVTRLLCLVPTKADVDFVRKILKSEADLAEQMDRITVDIIREHMELTE